MATIFRAYYVARLQRAVSVGRLPRAAPASGVLALGWYALPRWGTIGETVTQDACPGLVCLAPLGSIGETFTQGACPGMLRFWRLAAKATGSGGADYF